MPSPTMAGTKKIPVLFEKNPQMPMRSEYFTLFGELSCLFNLAYQAKAGVYFDIFLFCVGYLLGTASLTYTKTGGG